MHSEIGGPSWVRGARRHFSLGGGRADGLWRAPRAVVGRGSADTWELRVLADALPGRDAGVGVRGGLGVGTDQC
jgi:hypothetical protein